MEASQILKVWLMGPKCIVDPLNIKGWLSHECPTRDELSVEPKLSIDGLYIETWLGRDGRLA